MGDSCTAGDSCLKQQSLCTAVKYLYLCISGSKYLLCEVIYFLGEFPLPLLDHDQIIAGESSMKNVICHLPVCVNIYIFSDTSFLN